MSACAVPGCDQRISSDLLMCPAHWRRVPLLLKAAVNGTWNNRRIAARGPYYAQAVRLHEAAKRDAVQAVLERTP